MTVEPACEPLSVIILAGGASTRMGQNKLWLMLDGQPLIARVLRRVLPVASEIILSANDAQPFAPLLGALPVPVIVAPDQYAGAGPLAGLHAGLTAARHELALLLAADMPFVNLPLVRHLCGLAADYDAVIPMAPVRHIAKRRFPRPEPGALVEQPLHALYRRACLPAITARLDAGEYQMLSFFADVRTRYAAPEALRPFDPHLLSFFNVNTPDDWLEAQQLAQTADAAGVVPDAATGAATGATGEAVDDPR